MKIDQALRILETRVAGKTFRDGPTEVPEKDVLRWLKALKKLRSTVYPRGSLY